MIKAAKYIVIPFIILVFLIPTIAPAETSAGNPESPSPESLVGALAVHGQSQEQGFDLTAEGKPRHHSENGFRNYPAIADFAPVGAGFYFRRVMDSLFLPDVPDGHSLSEKEAIHQFQALNGKDSITWLGHSTFLIKMNGKTILTDPFLTEYASVVEVFGPRRFVAPGINLGNLPQIDMIVVSHNHYDHLDEETIESLPGKHNIHVFVPLGLTEFFKERDYENIHELDWHESASSAGIELTALPVVHFSGRGLNDRNKTLWCAWSISSPVSKVFFSGDTAYSPTIFKTIGQEHGPFNLAIVSIGTYKTRKYGPSSHLTPQQAVKVVVETRSRQAVAMHWGTIQLSDEPPWEPPVLFKKSTQDNGIADDDVWVMKIGESRQIFQ